MKKLVALALALLLALGVVSALADITPSQVVGAWYLQSRARFGESYIVDGDYRVELKRDKTALVVMDGIERQFTWSILGDSVRLAKPDGADYDNITSSFHLQDGLLHLNMEYDFSEEGSQLYDFVYGREPVVFAFPAWEHRAQEEDDFYGYYELDFISYPAERLVRMAEPGTVCVTISFAEFTVVQGERSVIIMTDYRDGLLFADASVMGRQYNNLKADISLDEGVLQVYVLDSDDNETFSLYFRSVSEEEKLARAEAARIVQEQALMEEEARMEQERAAMEMMEQERAAMEAMKNAQAQADAAAFFGDYEMKYTHNPVTNSTIPWPAGTTTAPSAPDQISFSYGNLKGALDYTFADGKLSLDGSVISAQYKNLTVEAAEEEGFLKLNILNEDGAVLDEVYFQRAEE